MIHVDISFTMIEDFIDVAHSQVLGVHFFRQVLTMPSCTSVCKDYSNLNLILILALTLHSSPTTTINYLLVGVNPAI